MQQIGKIYQMWAPDVQGAVRYHERQGFKKALQNEGFRWSESSVHSKLSIHDGGNLISDDRYKVGELDGNRIFVYSSSRLEQFLENYDS